MPSISDVAQKAGVSTATVSRTFRSPGLLNTQTHDRVMEAARLLNYKPRHASSVAASASKGGSVSPIAATNAIGFQFFSAVPSDTLFSNSFYGRILAGAQAEAARHGFHLLIHTTNRHALTRQMPRMVEEKAISGMLLVGTADPDVLFAFADHVPHLVLVDNRDATGNYESVISDGFGGAYAATRYLLDLGHKKLDFFCGEPTVTTFKDRIRGFLCAQIEAGIVPSTTSVFSESQTDTELEVLLCERLARPDRPTALLAANDHHAFIVMQACRKLGLSIPNDLSLVGFDDIPFSSQVVPALTTVHVDTQLMGRLAVRRLLASIVSDESMTHRENGMDETVERNRVDPLVCNEIPVSLVVRQSCERLIPSIP